MIDEKRAEADDQSDGGGSRFGSMPKSEIEALAVSAILEHRRLLAADGAVYEEWTRAAADSSVPQAVLEGLQEEYLARQMKSDAQQEELAEIIDALGYVPHVAPDAVD